MIDRVVWEIGLLRGRSMGLRGLSRLRREVDWEDGELYDTTVGSTLAGSVHTRLKLYNVTFYYYGISVYMIPIVQEQES